ncbi:Sodium/hydrogen exchanger family-domain-containing protein [Annulohypoxylon truncatum]|uniref:Sodium/hydrogen exchanger family-domain-containing protein n=1 Tax=Annulohypoxylon truncatum TaxID=327061 RepID=UPI0020072CFD|nr:Sodium/hydrogen exchanger family-domain-containing protein [Annulohypoxylon truncatum]KAI1205416.1 Sodium/hydrogen exchanger family-domain-containing protein [Annulohypoxylon truncatum]
MPTLEVSHFNIVLSLLGGWLSLFGLVSYLVKESLYISEALISLLAGAAFSPYAANLIDPLEYAGSRINLTSATLNFTRLVLGIQLVIAGIQLPSRYLVKEWRSLLLLLGPIMTLMWVTTSSIIWLMIPRLPFLHALAIGACVTPTDPVLSSVIVKGGFADLNISKDLQKIVIAESGLNDGLGYPFLFFALYLIKYTGGGEAESGGAGHAMGLFLGETCGYVVLLSIVYGAIVGWVAKRLLRFCDDRGFIDHEYSMVFAIPLSLFILGTCGLIGSDDILACFVAGNVFTWDDWFRLKTQDEPTIDTLLNVAIFMWYGIACPWNLFWENDTISFSHLIVLGILILLFRRLPYIFAFRSLLPQTRTRKDAAFMGFFGPIGCSAMFYLYITMEFVNGLKIDDGDVFREDVKFLRQDVRVVVWFLMICSVVVHGLCIPLGNIGLHLRRVASGNLQFRMDRYRTGISFGNASLFSSEAERQPILGSRL